MVPRCDADRLMAAAGAITIRKPSFPMRVCGRKTRAAHATIRNSSFSTPARSTATGTGKSPRTTPRRRRMMSLIRIAARNAGPEPAELHILPTLWFRNRWSWEDGVRETRDSRRVQRDGRRRDRRGRDARRMEARRRPRSRGPPADALVLRQRDQRSRSSSASPAATPYPKDGVNDHVVHGAATVNPERRGTKMACWHRVAVGAGETVELRLRLARDAPGRAIGPRRRLRRKRTPTEAAKRTNITPRCARKERATTKRW